MRKFIFFALITPLLASNIFPSSAQEISRRQAEDYPNYVVIGAFASHENAIKFTDQANRQKLETKYDINPNRNLYYVYVMATDDRPAAIREAIRLRKESPYFDTWVYQGAIGTGGSVRGASSIDIDPVTEDVMQAIEETTADNSKVPSTGGVDSDNNFRPEDSALAENDSGESTLRSRTEVFPVNKSLTRQEIATKAFVFAVSRGVDSEIVDADIDIVDEQTARKIGTYKANEPVKVTQPSGQSSNVLFACEVMGYRKAQKNFDFDAPSGEGIMLDGAGNIVIPFELVRLQKGDIAVMYNVFYYKDAAIMRPESRYEVNNLLAMLNENPNYRIKLHGHTNGNAHGKIITMGENENFFSLTGSRNGSGSAKKLSEERARTIQRYLVENGISEERIELKAWGGKRPLHDKHGAKAQENVRVEVEILSH